MSIVCGTDFSEHAQASARVAAAMAKALGRPLSLVHAGEALQVERERGARGALTATLEDEARKLAEKTGATVEAVLEAGPADEGLLRVAGRVKARLVVVGSLGDRKQHRWLLGSVAERVAQSSPVPVLVVRDAERLEAWASGAGGRLHVMVGVERTEGSLLALRWASELRAIGAVALTVVEVVWPPEEQKRLGVPPPVPLDHLRPELEATLRAELERWALAAGSLGDASFLVSGGFGRVDAHLAQLSSKAEADLLVVGTHQRAGVARLWQGSVSRGVLHGAAMSVACVPLPGASRP